MPGKVRVNRHVAIEKNLPRKCASVQSAFEKKQIIAQRSVVHRWDLMQLVEFTMQGRF